MTSYVNVLQVDSLSSNSTEMEGLCLRIILDNLEG
jgi:hypothetical protein